MCDFEPTLVSIERREAADWPALLQAIRDLTGWSDDTPVYAYGESVSECVLRRAELVTFTPSGDAFEGRLFAGNADVRWVARDASRFEAWITREGIGESVLARPRFYYLMGEYAGMADESPRPLGEGQGEGDPASGYVAFFTEGRYPGKRFEYPLAAGCAPGEHDRAFILVREYYREEPEWPRPSDPVSVDQIECMLDQLMLFAHRFVCVGVGRGGV